MSVQPFGVVLRPDRDLPVVEVRGELDVATAGDFRDVMHEALDLGTAEVAVDVSRLDFIDSTGLGVVVSAVKTLEHRGGVLSVFHPTRATRRVLEMTGLAERIKIVDGEGDPS